MNDLLYYILCGVLSLAVIAGISLMSKVKTAALGNGISAFATLAAIIVTLIKFNVFSGKLAICIILICLAIGSIIGIILAKKVKMIQMPELVALLNGIGGAASALVGACAIITSNSMFGVITATIALIIGTLTLTGSLVAAAKLAKLLNGKPIVWKNHQLYVVLSIIGILISIILSIVLYQLKLEKLMFIPLLVGTLTSAFFGYAYSIRVGGADMPITISLLNSLSGVAGAIAGMAIGDILLVAVGGIVGASGLLLTKIMCGSMNRSLMTILLGKTTSSKTENSHPLKASEEIIAEDNTEDNTEETVLEPTVPDLLAQAKKVIIVPGYGMALAQAQHLVKKLAVKLEKNGATVKFAIHPVAGRMPGHMNVLLCEADVDYEQLFEMHDINPEFKDCDVCIVVGANDVLNPSANTAEGTPIYGMPILDVGDARHIVIFNFDLKPGYAGVDNPLYTKKSGVTLCLGNASDTLANMLKELTF